MVGSLFMVGSLDNRHFVSICQAPGGFSSLAIQEFPVTVLSRFRKKTGLYGPSDVIWYVEYNFL
jgi:hypothetical protein